MLSNQTEYWGTPIYFDSDADRQGREMREQRAQERKVRQNQQQESERQLELDAEKEELEVAKDYELYLKYAVQFGGLNGALYACT